jgi:POT family proton-dependent oligopeptide transporter
MVNYFLWTQQKASGIYKWYTALVYLTPLLGGYLADRFLGNKWAIIIGALLMAAGEFGLTTSNINVFYIALGFLIVGNGFFKPNMSTQVGRLYAVGDPRRDGAYTIFYMGINLGAFLAPIICPALAEGTRWGYHAGFAAAGVGMLVGLATYLICLRWIEELPPGTKYEGISRGKEAGGHAAPPAYMTEQEAEKAPSALPSLSHAAPTLLIVLGVVAMLGAVALWAINVMSLADALAMGLGIGFAAFMAAYICSRVKMAVRDRVLAIGAVGIFVVFFWGAFEQAGNAMNVFADKVTNRYVTEAPPVPSVFPAIEAEKAKATVLEELGKAFKRIFSVNPMTTASFQAINPLGIFILAPLFAWLWTTLPRRGINLSIPAKMAIGVFMNGLAFALMIWAVNAESRPSSTTFANLPVGLVADQDSRVVFREAPDLDDAKGFEAFEELPKETKQFAVVTGGRLKFSPAQGKFDMIGVLADTDRDRLLRASVSKDYLEAVRQLAVQSKEAKRKAGADKPFEASVTLTQIPAGFDLRYAGFAPDKVSFDAATKALKTTVALEDRDYKRLLLAGVEPKLRDALNDLFVKSASFKVGVWWLFAFYILCTLGELCLSPVGLSMVSKLAPAKFATMLMGMWLLTSFFGNYAAGFAGELWGTVHPTTYFVAIAAALFGASAVCFLVTRKIVSMMHGVN